MVCPLPGVRVSGASGCRGRSSCQKRSVLSTSWPSAAPAASQNLGMTAAAGRFGSSSSGVFSSRSLPSPPFASGMTSTAGLASLSASRRSKVRVTPTTVIQSCGTPGWPWMSSITGNR